MTAIWIQKKISRIRMPIQGKAVDRTVRSMAFLTVDCWRRERLSPRPPPDEREGGNCAGAPTADGVHGSQEAGAGRGRAAGCE